MKGQKLTQNIIKKAKLKPKAYKLWDGQGLYLLVNSIGKYFRFDYRFQGLRKTLALGVFPDVTLAAARKAHQEARKQLLRGYDPMAVKTGRGGRMKKHFLAFFILDQNNRPIQPETLHDWLTWWLQNENRRIVAVDTLKDCQVSTVFLMVDHSHGFSDTPILFESAIFGGPYDDTRRWYSTWTQAQKGHAETVNMILESQK